MERIEVVVSNLRIFQHLVLLFDRPDFLRKAAEIQLKILLSPRKNNSVLEEYNLEYSHVPEEIFKEIECLREKYFYPQELSGAIIAGIVKGKVVDEDVLFYRPRAYSQKQPFKDYSHPILGLRADKNIKRDRDWYWLNKERYGHCGDRRDGYRRILKKSKVFLLSISTVQTAIKSYKKKLLVKIN